jgi:hypothetical protein
LIGAEEFLRGRIERRLDADGLEQRPHRIAHAGIVVHDHDDRIRGH